MIHLVLMRRNLHDSTRNFYNMIKKIYIAPLTTAGIALMVLFTLMVINACDSSMVFEKNQSIADVSWDMGDIVKFDVNIADTLSLHNFYITIRNTTDYKYSNIFLFIDTYFPDNCHTRDTIEFVLADIDGRWIGKGIGKIKENRILINRGVVFPIDGLYEINLEQAMREAELKGIADIGIRIEKM